MAAALLACLSIACVQDTDARVRALIERLAHEEIEARETAEQELGEAGRVALEALRKAARFAGNAEARVRAGRAAGRIVADMSWLWAQQPPRRVTLRADAVPLGQVLAEVERQTGLPYDASDLDLERRVSVRVTDVSLLAALDALCRSHGTLDYARGPGGEYRLLAQPRSALPAAYYGGYAVRLLRWQTPRVKDGQVDFEMARERERWPLEEAGQGLTIFAVDDTGRDVRVARMSGGAVPRCTWTLIGVHDDATRVTLQAPPSFRPCCRRSR